MSGKTTRDQRVQQAKDNAAAAARGAGKSEAEVRAAVMEADRLHADPRYQAHLDAMEDGQAKADKRNETLSELREWLDGKHREALREEPYGAFVSRIPLKLMKNLSPQELGQLEAFERRAFDRHRPLAQAREEHRRAFVGAGGDAAAFDANWETYGRDEFAAQLAGEQMERWRQEDSVF